MRQWWPSDLGRRIGSPNGEPHLTGTGTYKYGFKRRSILGFGRGLRYAFRHRNDIPANQWIRAPTNAQLRTWDRPILARGPTCLP